MTDKHLLALETIAQKARTIVSHVRGNGGFTGHRAPEFGSHDRDVLVAFADEVAVVIGQLGPSSREAR